MVGRTACIRAILPAPMPHAKRIDSAIERAHNAPMKMALSFLAMGILAMVLWRILRHQESSDPSFERRLDADDRRARANRNAAARDSAGTQPPESTG